MRPAGDLGHTRWALQLSCLGSRTFDLVEAAEASVAIGVQPADEAGEREGQMRLVSRFMRWKLSPAFTLASEITSPDAVYCIGVSHHECHAAMSRITRNPVRFGEVEWLTPAQIGDEYVSLLPRGAAKLDAKEIAELQEWCRVPPRPRSCADARRAQDGRLAAATGVYRWPVPTLRAA